MLRVLSATSKHGELKLSTSNCCYLKFLQNMLLGLNQIEVCTWFKLYFGSYGVLGVYTRQSNRYSVQMLTSDELITGAQLLLLEFGNDATI